MVKVIKLWDIDYPRGMRAIMDKEHFAALCKIGLKQSDTMYIIANDNFLEGL